MMRRRRRFNEPSLIGFAIVSLLLFHHTLDAAQTQIFSGPVSMAMGGGGRAGNEATEMIFLNPASVAMTQGFETGFSYRDGYWANGEHESSFHASMLENDDGNFAIGGLAFAQKRRTAPNIAWGERILMAALAKTISPNLSVGTSFYQMTQKTNVGKRYTQWNGSLGATFTLGPALGFSYVLANLANVDEKIPEVMKQIPQQTIAASVLFQQLLRLTVDITRLEKQNPDKKGIIQIGNEMRASEFGLFRIGFELDDIEKKNSLTAGVGFIGPRLRANYAIVKPLKETGGAMHSVDLRLPF